MIMEFERYLKKDMPENAFVVRVIKTNEYIHIYNKKVMYIKPKMMGCMVFSSEEQAKEIVDMLKMIETELCGLTDESQTTEYEIVPFNEAYDKHGIIEKQIVCN